MPGADVQVRVFTFVLGLLGQPAATAVLSAAVSAASVEVLDEGFVVPELLAGLLEPPPVTA